MGSNSSSGSGGGSNRYEPPKKKKSIPDALVAIANLSPTVRALKAVGSSIQKSKTDKALQGTSDYQGSTRKSKVSIAGGSQRGNDNSNVGAATSSGMVVQSPTVISPTTSEVSQVTSADAREAADLLIKKRKGRGRSSTILTSAQGVQDNKGLTLGKPSLLG